RNVYAPPFHFSRRPHQSICPPDTVSVPDHGTGLEPQVHQGGIPPASPHTLTCMLQSLPPILYRCTRDSISSYSKAPRGLSVLSRVSSIFTGAMISPSLSLRQCPNRCAFRAGQNLPDKEFRYLRTAIVTAAVYWRFDLYLRLRYVRLLTFQRRAGVSPYTSPCGLAETYVFAKQSLGPIHCGSFS